MSDMVHFGSTQHEYASFNNSTPLPESLSSSIGISSYEIDMPRLKDGSSILQLVNRLDALLMVLKTCKGRQCTHPWEFLFPAGIVKSLADAIDPRFDDFFETKVEKVDFGRCEKGYITESEGPIWNSKQVYAMADEVAFD